LQQFMTYVTRRITEDHGEHSDTISNSNFNADDLLQRVREAAQGLINRYVRLQGKMLCKMIRKGIETPNWIKQKEPRDVRLVTELFVNGIFIIAEHIKFLFEMMPPSAFMRTSPLLTMIRNQKVPKLNLKSPEGLPRTKSSTISERKPESSLHRSRASTSSLATPPLTKGSPSGTLFETKILSTFAEGVMCNVESVLMGILKISIKCFVECVRMCTLGRYGYQQMQVDIEFMHVTLVELFFVERPTVSVLLKDVKSEVGLRSIDKQSMEPSVISSLVNNKLQKWRSDNNITTTIMASSPTKVV